MIGLCSLVVVVCFCFIHGKFNHTILGIHLCYLVCVAECNEERNMLIYDEYAFIKMMIIILFNFSD